MRASSPSAPTSLVVKTYGGNIFTKQAAELSSINSCLVQSIIFHQQSTRGWGPKLYGLFDGGRIEEFIDCHTLTAQEAFSDELMADVVTAYACFHSLKLSIKQHSYDFLAQLLLFAVGARASTSSIGSRPECFCLHHHFRPQTVLCPRPGSSHRKPHRPHADLKLQFSSKSD